MDLEVGIADLKYADLAAAFKKVTGHPAQYIDVNLEDFWTKGAMSNAANLPAAYNSSEGMTIRENFTGFWNFWKDRVITRDYSLLDEIFPDRIKTAEEFFRREDEKARKQGQGGLWEKVQSDNLKPILKLVEDKRRGRL